jgi:cell division septal protein FtsQ
MALRTRGDMIAKVDMRYVNGFAVRWRDDSAVNQVQLAGLTESGD